VFGCSCLRLLKPYNAHKCDFRYHECLFLGYSTTHKEYTCLSPSGRTFISKDVLFNEYVFPFSSIFQNYFYIHSIPLEMSPCSLYPIIILASLLFFKISPPLPLQSLNSQTASPSPQTFHVYGNRSIAITETYPSSFSQNLPHTTANLLVNSHPLQTCSKSGIVLPHLNPNLFLTYTEPKNVKHALHDPKWRATMQEELCYTEKQHLVHGAFTF